MLRRQLLFLASIVMMIPVVAADLSDAASNLTPSSPDLSPRLSVSSPGALDALDSPKLQGSISADINWPMILADSDAGYAARHQFAQAYMAARSIRDLSLASQLVAQCCDNIAHTSLSLSDLSAALQQISHICQLGGTHGDCCIKTPKSTDDTNHTAVQKYYAVTQWSVIPLICTRHFTGRDHDIMVGQLQTLAMVLYRAGQIAQLDPLVLSTRLCALCDYRLLRFLGIQAYVGKYATAANLATLQDKILAQLIVSPIAPAAEMVVADESVGLSNIEYALVVT